MANLLTKSSFEFNSQSRWDQPISKLVYSPTPDDLELFDQNGYDLTIVEQLFYFSNNQDIEQHRNSQHFALKKPWLEQTRRMELSVLNHCCLFERKGYSGDALKQLKMWARDLPLVHKVINIRPKWGLDFSMDYVDQQGNSFEVLHWEWDSFNYDEICQVKEKVEPILLSIDWDTAAKDMLNQKSKWHDLDFFAQSDWKCKFFDIPREQFKMVCWQ